MKTKTETEIKILNHGQPTKSEGKQLAIAITAKMNTKYGENFDVGYYQQARYIKDKISSDFSFDITSLLSLLDRTIIATQWIYGKSDNEGHAGANKASRDIKELIRRITSNAQ